MKQYRARHARINNYQETKYPKIFRGCYWGTYICYGNTRMSGEPKIEDFRPHRTHLYENRNWLVEHFGIKKSRSKETKKILKAFGDVSTRHREAYLLKNGRTLLMTHSYDYTDDTELPGWTRLEKPIWDEGPDSVSHTFYKIQV